MMQAQIARGPSARLCASLLFDKDPVFSFLPDLPGNEGLLYTSTLPCLGNQFSGVVSDIKGTVVHWPTIHHRHCLNSDRTSQWQLGLCVACGACQEFSFVAACVDVYRDSNVLSNLQSFRHPSIKAHTCIWAEGK